jgi:hypothetical protein
MAASTIVITGRYGKYCDKYLRVKMVYHYLYHGAFINGPVTDGDCRLLLQL